ncbi:MAG: hypothetical protein R3F19_17355 [Verrucomicrobiales bacterium]
MIVGIAGFVWLAASHHIAVRRGYAPEKAVDNTITFPVASSGQHGVLQALFYVTPVFAPDLPIAVLPISMDFGRGRQEEIIKSIDLHGKEMNLVVEIEGHFPEPTAISAKFRNPGYSRGSRRKDRAIQGGDFAAARFLLSAIKFEAVPEIDLATSRSGKGGGGIFVSDGVKDGWRWREQGTSESYRLWGCAFYSDQSPDNRPISINLDELIQRTRDLTSEPWIDPKRMFEEGVLKHGGFLVTLSDMEAPFSIFGLQFILDNLGSYTGPLSQADGLLFAFQWPVVIAIGCAILIGVSVRHHKKCAVLVMVVMSIGFLAVLDRLSVRHASIHLEDVSASVHQRCVAASKLSETFFWKRTAREVLGRARGHESAGVTHFYNQMIEHLK